MLFFKNRSAWSDIWIGDLFSTYYRCSYGSSKRLDYQRKITYFCRRSVNKKVLFNMKFKYRCLWSSSNAKPDRSTTTNYIKGDENLMQNSRYLKDYPDVLTPEEVMTILGIGKNSTYKLLQTGELKSIKIGKKYRIPKKYLLQYINA